MTDQFIRFPRFYLTVPSACPYLPGRLEQKIFTELKDPHAQDLNDSLSKVGFRRSQKVAYKPACDGCNACISVRIPVRDFRPGRTMRRIMKRNADLTRNSLPAHATLEQFELLTGYLNSRHSNGGMAGMTAIDYATMVEETPVTTFLVEYRQRSLDPLSPTDPLMAACLTDVLDDGVSMIYSFYDPAQTDRSLGTYMILAHVEWARKLGLPYVYLGYWIAGSDKMAYKAKFQPLEMYADDTWRRMKA
ncbi:MAG: arginyltransferase [Alphaproteobacteria bacterium]|nr:arginyltransferase [Alphaproteobacteria bacterium]